MLRGFFLFTFSLGALAAPMRRFGILNRANVEPFALPHPVDGPGTKHRSTIELEIFTKNWYLYALQAQRLTHLLPEQPRLFRSRVLSPLTYASTSLISARVTSGLILFL